MSVFLVATTGTACDVLWPGPGPDPVPPLVPTSAPQNMTREEFRDFAQSQDGIKNAEVKDGYIRIEVDGKASPGELSATMDKLSDKYRMARFGGGGADLLIVSGVFEAELNHVDPSASPSIPRDTFPSFDVVHQLAGHKHITSGKIQGKRVYATVDKDPFDWMRTEAKDIDGVFTATNGEKEDAKRTTVTMNPHDVAQQRLADALHTVVKKNGGELRELEVGFEPQTSSDEVSVHASFPDAKAVDKVSGAFAKDHKDVSTRFTTSGLQIIQSAEGSLPRHRKQIGSEQTLRLYRQLTAKNINVEIADLSEARFEVALETSQQIRTTLSEVSGLPAGVGSVSVRHKDQRAHGNTNLNRDEWDEYASVVTHMWDAGFHDFTLSARSQQNAKFSVDFEPPVGGPALRPSHARAGIQALRASGYDGVASITVNEGNHLNFMSTVCGKAKKARNSLSGSPSKPDGAERAFIDEWNRTATC